MASVPALYLPKQPDLLEKYGQLMQLKNSQMQSALQQQEAPLRLQALQQQVQGGDLENQQKQTQLKDQQATTAAMQSWDGKNLDDLAPLVLKHGGSATAVMGLKQHALEQRAKVAAIAKDDATTGKDQIATQMQKNTALSGALGSILQLPDEQLPQAIQATAAQLVQQGVLDPQHGQAAQQLAALPPAQARQQLDIMRKGVTSNTQLLEQTKQEQAAANEKALRDQATANAAQTAQHQSVEEKQGQQRIGIEGARLAFDKARQGTQDQQSIEQQAQQIASGDVKGLSQARNSPFARAVMARVYDINPKYSDALYTGKQQFKTGADSTSIVQLGTALKHADNALANSAKVGFAPLLGSNATATDAAYNKDVEYLTGEVGKLVTGKALTVDEGRKLTSGLDSSRQDIRDAAIKESLDLLSGKTSAIFQKYKNATGTDLPVEQYFDKDTQGRLQKYGISTGAAAPTGGDHPFFQQFGGAAK